MAESLYLKAGDHLITGWTLAEFSAGLERFPRSFHCELTEPLDENHKALGSFEEGMPIEVYIGMDKVLTGYIDVVSCSVSATDHTVSIAGRSMGEDIIDCSAEVTGHPGEPIIQMGNRSASDIAQDLATPYGIKVIAGDLPKSKFIPMFQINTGETAYQVIERVARYSGFLIYDSADGDLILGAPASEPKASGKLLQGDNVLEAHTEFNLAERFGEYHFYTHDGSATKDQQAAIPGAPRFGTDGDASHGVAKDAVFEKYPTPKGGKRNRKLIQISDQVVAGEYSVKTRAMWECNRRAGRSQRIAITVPSWRDSAGNLFKPNSEIDFSAPACRITDKTWLICDVTFSKSSRGTLCELVLMPKEAFSIEPYEIQPMDHGTIESIRDSKVSDVPGNPDSSPDGGIVSRPVGGFNVGGT